MKAHLLTAAVAGVVTVAVVTAGCGDKSSTQTASSTPATSSKSASSSTGTSAVASPKDYSALLIDAQDIVAPGDTFSAQAPTLNPGGKPGVATVFTNGGDTREIGDTILVLPDADAASAALQGATSALSSSVTGGTPAKASVGSDSVMIAGASPDGAKAVTVVLFTEGKALTTLEFDSAAGDPVPPESALDVAGKQDQKIKAGLGG